MQQKIILSCQADQLVCNLLSMLVRSQIPYNPRTLRIIERANKRAERRHDY